MGVRGRAGWSGVCAWVEGWGKGSEGGVGWSAVGEGAAIEIMEMVITMHMRGRTLRMGVDACE